MNKFSISFLTFVLGAGVAQIPLLYADENKNEEKQCIVHYEGDHTVFIICGNEVTFKTDREHLKDMIRIEDVSMHTPAGGKNSLPREGFDKIVKKPAKWLKKRLGL